ncbi:anaerobic ribonucleoside-triphosphate reductase [Blastochloris sulfoviridis]|nr:anaerobic ribonucleoside-triphosphate reductase [Blastochloris sulfoviridis]
MTHMPKSVSMTPATMTPAIELDDAERQPCEIWTRVMGYHRPVASFNRGKQGEFAERRCFSERQAKLESKGD